MRPFVSLCFQKLFSVMSKSQIQLSSFVHHPGVPDEPYSLNFLVLFLIVSSPKRIFSDWNFQKTVFQTVQSIRDPGTRPLLTQRLWAKATFAGRLSDSFFPRGWAKVHINWLIFWRKIKPEVPPEVERRKTYPRRNFRSFKLNNTGFTIDQTKIGSKKLKLFRWK